MATVTQDIIPIHGSSINEDLDFENPKGWGCGGCFQSFWPNRRITGDDDDRGNLLPHRRQHKAALWFIITPLNKLKHASEVLAGPKWKTLLRKFGAHFNSSKKKKVDFQYDSFNYTLNFDDGVHEDDEDAGNLGFSTRFAPPVHDQPKSST